jgi:SAM-dependent methyltransferase
VGKVDFGDLRRVTPISRGYGVDRGTPIDRYYIHRFLESRSVHVRGRVLEIGDNVYTRRYGGDRVTASDILHVSADNPKATIVGDLSDAPHIPAGSFDTIILTQTLLLIYDLRAAVATLHRILRPGGVLLVTVPGIVCVEMRSQWAATWCWSFTEYSLRRLLMETFDEGQIETAVHGNVFSAIAFLEGLCAEELEPADLDHLDRDYPVTITACVTKVGTVT